MSIALAGEFFTSSATWEAPLHGEIRTQFAGAGFRPNRVSVSLPQDRHDASSYSPWNSPGQDTGVGSLPLLQGIFPTQGSNPGAFPLDLGARPLCRRLRGRGCENPSLQQHLLHWQAYSLPLSHLGSPQILKWKKSTVLEQ